MDGYLAASIRLLTADELADIERVANGSGRLAKAWAQLTQVVRERLGHGVLKKSRARTRVYGDGDNYVFFRLGRDTELTIEFGFVGADREQQRLGHLRAHWDELGLTGPYRVIIRGREHGLGTFAAVLERYLTLPELQ